MTQNRSVTILGDSTIDNKVWVSPGLAANMVLNQLHLANGLKKARYFFGHPHSVIEHLQYILPDHKVHDYSNDGFTTTDCLGSPWGNKGAYRDKVFRRQFGPFNEFNPFPTMFPHEHFNPLDAAKEDIKNSQHIILSIGGNNFREFLEKAKSFKDKKATESFIIKNFDNMLKQMQEEYILLFDEIRKLNPDAQIILMTQYYPSISQDHYDIYPFLHQLGKIMKIGGDTHDPIMVIHDLMMKTYVSILENIAPKNVVIADITSSLNPYDSDNHVSQIEPSDIGGKKIAQMLKYIITSPVSSGEVYRFLPAFFKGPSTKHIEKISFKYWQPKNPRDFINEGNSLEKLLNQIVSLKNTYVPSDPIYAAAAKVHKEAKTVQRKVSNKKEFDNLTQSLRVAIAVLRDRKDPRALLNLRMNAEQSAYGKSSLWEKFGGALMMLAGAAAIGLSIVGIPFTDGLSAIAGYAGGSALCVSGMSLFAHGRQKALSKSLVKLAKAAEDKVHPIYKNTAYRFSRS